MCFSMCAVGVVFVWLRAKMINVTKIGGYTFIIYGILCVYMQYPSRLQYSLLDCFVSVLYSWCFLCGPYERMNKVSPTRIETDEKLMKQNILRRWKNIYSIEPNLPINVMLMMMMIQCQRVGRQCANRICFLGCSGKVFERDVNNKLFWEFRGCNYSI